MTTIDKARLTEMLTTRLYQLNGDSGIVVLAAGENAPGNVVIGLRMARLMLRRLLKSGPSSGATDRGEWELQLVGLISPEKTEVKGAYAAAGLETKVALKLRDWGDYDGTTDRHTLAVSSIESSTTHGEDEQGLVVVEEITIKGYVERSGGDGQASLTPLAI